MAKKHFIMKQKLKENAKNDILSYIELAEKSFKTDKKKANLYVHKLRNLAMKHQIRLPKEIKRKFCKHCYAYLMPGVNCRVRTREGKLIYYCMECKNYTRKKLS
jgi:ribonuclease P protein subunit RPR2